jgi:NADH-quinone oxidoreductase subunit L
MTVPLMLLCIGAVAAGWVGIPALIGENIGVHNYIAEFMKPVLGHPEGHGTHMEELVVMGISVLVGFSGIGLAYFMYVVRTDLPATLTRQFSAVHKVLFNKYYVDELYSAAIIRPTIWIAKNVLIGITDARIIEAIVNGVPNAIGAFSQGLRRIQTGLLQHYAAFMATGVFIIILTYVWLR